MAATRFTALVVSLFGMYSLQANAGTVTDCGPSICYTYDDAQAATALFGTPTLVGDSLVFLPPSFRADTTTLDVSETTDIVVANFIFDEIYSVNNVDITRLIAYESGDYDIIGGSEVGADVLFTVVNLEPNPGFPPLPESGTNLTSFTATGDSGGQQEWELYNDYIFGDDFDLTTKSLQVSLQNTLTAIASNPDEAWIQKKLTFTAAVPVPAAVWLFGSGLGLLGFTRLRRSKS
jgi:hypothetical protein